MTEGPAPAQLAVTVVHAPACHFCLDAENALAELSERFAIDVRRIEIDSPEGRALVAHHRPAMNPLVLLDGLFFSAGRLPRKKLTKLLLARHGLPSLPAPARSEVRHGL